MKDDCSGSHTNTVDGERLHTDALSVRSPRSTAEAELPQVAVCTALVESSFEGSWLARPREKSKRGSSDRQAEEGGRGSSQ